MLSKILLVLSLATAQTLIIDTQTVFAQGTRGGRAAQARIDLERNVQGKDWNSAITDLYEMINEAAASGDEAEVASLREYLQRLIELRDYQAPIRAAYVEQVQQAILARFNPPATDWVAEFNVQVVISDVGERRIDAESISGNSELNELLREAISGAVFPPKPPELGWVNIMFTLWSLNASEKGIE